MENVRTALAVIGGITVVIIGYNLWSSSGLQVRSPIVYSGYQCALCDGGDAPNRADYDLVRRAYKRIGQ